MPRKPKDKHLDVPSVANEEKHINFLAEDEKANDNNSDTDSENKLINERKKQWNEGIKEGEEELEKDPPFEKRDLNEDEEY